MIAWVMYDIEIDKSRTKVAKLCKQAGLYRVQFSVFLGTICIFLSCGPTVPAMETHLLIGQ